MTIRRINHTKRRRIDKQDVTIRLSEPLSSPPVFSARVDLSKHDSLPSDAKIYIEAYRQTTRMRFDFGTVLNPGFDGGRAILAEFVDADAVQFAVKVTGVSGATAGMLLADRDGIPPTAIGEDTTREPLLPTCSSDLGQELWRLDFHNSGAILQINNRIPDWKGFAASAQFKALAYPSIIRQVLTRILIVDEWNDSDDSDDWRSKWLFFARSLPGVEVLDEEPDDAAGRWERIEEFATAFTGHASLMALCGHS
jgi:hypothetical protein